MIKLKCIKKSGNRKLTKEINEIVTRVKES